VAEDDRYFVLYLRNRLFYADKRSLTGDISSASALLRGGTKKYTCGKIIGSDTCMTLARVDRLDICLNILFPFH
jgi:hypothetical protein